MNNKTDFSIDELSFRFTTDTQPFFSNVSYTLDAGLIHGVVGKNGSGKSTLFRILQGRVKSGELLKGLLSIGNTKINLADIAAGKQCSIYIKAVVQQIHEMVVSTCTVRQNLQLAHLPAFPGLQRLPDAPDMTTILQKVHINPESYVHQLSGGQRQILAILMMLGKSARVLLLDEPTSALDYQNSRMVMDCITELARSKQLVIIIISHDRELIKSCITGKLLEIEQYENGQRALRQINTGINT